MGPPIQGRIARTLLAVVLSTAAGCTGPEPVVVGGEPPIPPPSRLGDDFGAREWSFGRQVDLMTAAPALAGPTSLEHALALLAAAIELIPAGDGLGAVEAGRRIRAAVVAMERAEPDPVKQAEAARAGLAIAAVVLGRAAYAPYPAAAGPSRDLGRALGRPATGTVTNPVAPAWLDALRAARAGLEAIRTSATMLPVEP